MKKIYRIGIIVLIGFFLIFVQYQGYFDRFDSSITDLMYQQESYIDNTIKLIVIDEKTIEEYGNFGSWSRDLYGTLIDLLNENGKPAIIGFDILFSGELDEKGDQHFVEACQRHGNVYVVNNLVYSTRLIKENNVLIGVDHMNIDEIEMPFSALKKVTKQGYSNTVLDSDGYVRTHIPYVDYEGERYDSFASAIAKEYSQLIGENYLPPQTYGSNLFGIKYCGKNHAYEEVSLYDVMAGNIDLRVFKNSIVLLGAHASAMQDAYNVPIENGNQMYGVEIHANIIQSLMDGRTYIKFDKIVYSTIILLLYFLYVFIVRKSSLGKSLLYNIILLVAYTVFAHWMFRFGYYIPVFLVYLSFLLLYGGEIIVHYYHEYKEKKETMQLFKRYVAPNIVDKIVSNKDHWIDLSGEIRDIAVLFVDIRGFTSLSEKLTGKQVVEMLNEYFTQVSSIVFEMEGTLDKYIGDAVMAVFNAPIDIKDYEMKAVQTGLKIAEIQKVVSAFTEENYGISLEFGIGIHCGQAVVGNIGCQRRFDFTSIGDCVNTASRIESISKNAQVLISQEMYDRLNDRIIVEKIGKVHLKGKNEETEIYKVICLKEASLDV